MWVIAFFGGGCQSLSKVRRMLFRRVVQGRCRSFNAGGRYLMGMGDGEVWARVMGWNVGVLVVWRGGLVQGLEFKGMRKWFS